MSAKKTKKNHMPLEDRSAMSDIIDTDGLEACFDKHVWPDVNDGKFHKLKNLYLKAAKDLHDYVYLSIKDDPFTKDEAT